MYIENADTINVTIFRHLNTSYPEKIYSWRQPYRSCLIHWEIRVLLVRRIRKRAWSRSLRIGVVQDRNSSSSIPRRISKPRTGNNIVITTTILIHCDQKWVWLTNMNIHRWIVLLNCVRTFSLHKKKVMALNSKIQASWYTNIVHPEAICFSCSHTETKIWLLI